ncbi:hypothetical protein OH77DRAFT_1536768 [Trametes cingulata]|nr:hypothetical protein OH77DRAFT_1536768 [Trametes cingulata]
MTSWHQALPVTASAPTAADPAAYLCLPEMLCKCNAWDSHFDVRIARASALHPPPDALSCERDLCGTATAARYRSGGLNLQLQDLSADVREARSYVFYGAQDVNDLSATYSTYGDGPDSRIDLPLSEDPHKARSSRIRRYCFSYLLRAQRSSSSPIIDHCLRGSSGRCGMCILPARCFVRICRAHTQTGNFETARRRLWHEEGSSRAGTAAGALHFQLLRLRLLCSYLAAASLTKGPSKVRMRSALQNTRADGTNKLKFEFERTACTREGQRAKLQAPEDPPRTLQPARLAQLLPAAVFRGRPPEGAVAVYVYVVQG